MLLYLFSEIPFRFDMPLPCPLFLFLSSSVVRYRSISRFFIVQARQLTNEPWYISLNLFFIWGILCWGGCIFKCGSHEGCVLGLESLFVHVSEDSTNANQFASTVDVVVIMCASGIRFGVMSIPISFCLKHENVYFSDHFWNVSHCILRYHSTSMSWDFSLVLHRLQPLI